MKKQNNTKEIVWPLPPDKIITVHRVELDEEMEEPCLCDCGTWFDLHKGYHGRNNKIVCQRCHDLIIQIDDLENDLYNLECQDNKKRQIKKLKKHIEILQEELLCHSRKQ